MLPTCARIKLKDLKVSLPYKGKRVLEDKIVWCISKRLIREFLTDVWIPPTLLNKNFKDVSKEANEPLNKKLVFQ